MPVSDVAFRPETPADYAAIRSLLIDAFSGPAEADLVERLRADDDVLTAFAAVASGLVVGTIVFVRLRFETGDQSVSAAGLAPLAVSPRWQKRGMVRAGLDALARQGQQLVFVLGDPAYYKRFGFEVRTAAAYASAYSGPHFMALALGDELPPPGSLAYPQAFSGLV
jgi:putative acetyltransferase